MRHCRPGQGHLAADGEPGFEARTPCHAGRADLRCPERFSPGACPSLADVGFTVRYSSLWRQVGLLVTGKRSVRHIVFDTNYWNSFVNARFTVPMGDPECLSLFGSKSEPHRMLSEHLTSEYRVRTEGRGRTVDEWKVRVDGLDNHWLDCLVGSAVAASMQGAVLFGTDHKAVVRPRLKLSALRGRTS